MVDLIGFWVSVTILSVTPVLFVMHHITRWILSAAKRNAPSLPDDLLPRGNRYWMDHWETHLYPVWAHKLNRLFLGGLCWQYELVGWILSIPTSLFMLVLATGGAAHEGTTTLYGLVEGIAYAADGMATLVGVLFTFGLVMFGSYFLVSKGTYLIGMLQIQEMREKKKNDSKS